MQYFRQIHLQTRFLLSLTQCAVFMWYKLCVCSESAFANCVSVVQMIFPVKMKMIGAAGVEAPRFDYSLYLCDTHFRVSRIPMKLQLSTFQGFSPILTCSLLLHWPHVLWKTAFALMSLCPVSSRKFFHLYYVGIIHRNLRSQIHIVKKCHFFCFLKDTTIFFL